MSLIRQIIAAILLVAAISAAPTGVQADPHIAVIKKYYEISGDTGRALKLMMKENGPKGFWAYTRWYVRWSSNCNVSVRITYTYPRLKDRETVPVALLRQWDRMMVKLVQHEENHGQHGINAAKEIRRKNCKNANAIIRKWDAIGKKYDRQTEHGKNEGIYLPN